VRWGHSSGSRSDMPRNATMIKRVRSLVASSRSCDSRCKDFHPNLKRGELILFWVASFEQALTLFLDVFFGGFLLFLWE
jgi:hypothetical protein